MPTKIESAYIDEISVIEARMASDASMLALLKRQLAEYRSAFLVPHHSRSQSGSTVFMSGTVSTAAALGVVTVSTSRPRSPQRQAIIDEAREFLRAAALGADGYALPQRTADILKHLEAKAILVPGTNPLNNLSAMLSNAGEFRAHGKRGWTLATNENPADATILAQESVSGNHEDGLDPSVELPARGREAGPGGGT